MRNGGITSRITYLSMMRINPILAW
jgi:hypothetical protein